MADDERLLKLKEKYNQLKQAGNICPFVSSWRGGEGSQAARACG